MSTAVTQATTAAPLAALLPVSMNGKWRTGPAPYGIRNNVATSRLTDGRRALIVVEEGNRVELYADRPDVFPTTPDAVVEGTDPTAVAALAARALRWILPRLDAERMWADAGGFRDPADQWQRFLRLKGAYLIDVGFLLVDHGAHPVPRELPGQMAWKADHMNELGHALAMERPDGPGLAWTAASGAEWGVWSHGCGPTYTLTYEGPMHGLYEVLPVLLPPLGAHTPTDAGSPFTRHLTDRFPQLRPVDADEVEFGGYQDLDGSIVLPSRAEPGDLPNDGTRICARVSSVGSDFLLAAAAYLV
ncbi:hypothetical protein ACF08W_29335 [Streptomyces sp. NPDC015144]|uniref:hypothetical protein n=1 Tax=Streptomyces sp. NPDC015144 TaxID=3364944 RepID=UPI003702728A